MLKRIALFILAHMAFLGVAAAIVAASTTDADAQRSDNPYDMRFVTTQEQSLRAGPEMDSAVSGTVDAGVRDVSMRWCRPEFDFQGWMFGSPRAQQIQLDERVCEVNADGQVGFIPGSALRVQ
ncbi:MAG: hypothetical protein ACE360_07240 [Hyphomicrobiales bacterium]|jgi:hypothetical protein